MNEEMLSVSMISKSHLFLNARTRESTYANGRISCVMPSAAAAAAVTKRAGRFLNSPSVRFDPRVRQKRCQDERQRKPTLYLPFVIEKRLSESQLSLDLS